MPLASLFALAVMAAEPATRAPAKGLPEEPVPAGAPADDYGLVNWCAGALSGHMVLYHLVKPDLDALPDASPKESAALDADQIKAGRDYLTLYKRAIDAAERASPRVISARGLAMRRQGDSIWTALRASQDGKTRMWTWLSWELPGRCETAAERLYEKSLLNARALGIDVVSGASAAANTPITPQIGDTPATLTTPTTRTVTSATPPAKGRGAAATKAGASATATADAGTTTPAAAALASASTTGETDPAQAGAASDAGVQGSAASALAGSAPTGSAPTGSAPTGSATTGATTDVASTAGATATGAGKRPLASGRTTRLAAAPVRPSLPIEEEFQAEIEGKPEVLAQSAPAPARLRTSAQPLTPLTKAEVEAKAKADAQAKANQFAADAEAAYQAVAQGKPLPKPAPTADSEVIQTQTQP